MEVGSSVDVRVVQGEITTIETPLLVVSTLEEAELEGSARQIDEALGGLLSRLVRDGEISGELATVSVVHVADGAPVKARRIAVVGLGKRADLDREAVRVAAATAARKVQDLKLKDFATTIYGVGIAGMDVPEATRVIAECSRLALYRYEQFKESTKSKHQVDLMAVVADQARDVAAVESAVVLATRVSDAVMLTRDLSVGPSNHVTPTFLADQARAVAERHQLEITVWGKPELEEHGMRAILAVNRGSAEPPVFVALRYNAPGATKTLAVVGKGITFDSGGISIKPADHMEYMRHDMSGAAAVIGFVDLAAAAGAPVNVLGVFAATENLPSATAYKPGDVIRAYNGKTMEIVNTDAEGRVILSDALAYTAEQKPDAIVDLATLTGACHIALGDYATGLMSNNQELADRVLAAGETSGERCWQLPLWKVYRKQIDTAMADLRNTGGRPAGAITAAKFLEEFVGEVPWVHLDIAGTAYSQGSESYVAPYNPRPGASGVGVRLLWQLCQDWASA